MLHRPAEIHCILAKEDHELSTVTTLRSSRTAAPVSAIGAAHSEQNLAPAWFSWPHAAQRFMPPRLPPVRGLSVWSGVWTL